MPLIQETLQTGSNQVFDMSCYERVYSFTIAPFVDSGYVNLYCQDITEIKRVENKLRLAKLEAEKADRAKSEFLANMSHEIRTPMTAILGFADLLMDNAKEPQTVDLINTIKRNGKHLLGIINDILDLSKVESGNIEFECVMCSPSQIVADVASLMRVKADAKGLALEVKIEGPIPESICSDPTRLRQILINLVGNAVKFTETGRIQLVTRLQDANSSEPKLKFDIIDTGIGMSEEQADKLFQPFTQADTSTTRQFGCTGLGLSISKRLAMQFGGDVSVTSVSGQGSTFSVTVTTGSLEGVRMFDNPTESSRKTHALTLETPRGISRNFPAASCWPKMVLTIND
jgi:signal transduction histidine kinase